MNEIEIKEFIDYLDGSNDILVKYQVILDKYQIKSKEEQISLKKAIQFIRDVFEVDFAYYDKFIRYARKYNLLIEENKTQRNWKLKISYENIFNLMLLPLYEVLKEKEKI